MWSATGTLRTIWLKLHDLLGRQRRRDANRHVGRRLLHDLELFLLVRVVDEDVEHEAVELGLGQRIGAFLLDRVLRGQHEERLGQRVPLAADRDLVLLHRLQQGGLRLGRRAVDFVGQDHVGEDRPLEELELARAGRACPPE